uniref:Uncharacterized protein n=1 Tax=Arundo donax TaxID=35708 RepID=A0A0A8YG94_ARUDO
MAGLGEETACPMGDGVACGIGGGELAFCVAPPSPDTVGAGELCTVVDTSTMKSLRCQPPLSSLLLQSQPRFSSKTRSQVT